MAIPIKAQIEIISPNIEWKSVMLLTDGSLYVVDENFKVRPVDRSYAGHVVKNYMNEIATAYHDHMYYASCARHSGDYMNDEFFSQCAETINVQYNTIKKFWKAFKSFSRKVKKNTNSNVVVNRMVVKNKQQIMEVDGLDIEQERPARNNRDKEIGSRKSGRRDENGRLRKL